MFPFFFNQEKKRGVVLDYFPVKTGLRFSMKAVTASVRSLDGTKYIVLNLEQVAEIDLSCLQLLCSAHQTFMRSNKKVALSGLCSGTFQKTVADAGYSSRKGCIMDTDENCLFVTALHGVEELRS